MKNYLLLVNGRLSLNIYKLVKTTMMMTEHGR